MQLQHIPMSPYNTLDMSMNTSNILNFPPVTKQRALRIAAHATHLGSQQLSCHSQLPANCNVHGVNFTEPCWYILTPLSNKLDCPQSDRLLIISRVNGAILYDGSTAHPNNH